MIIDHIEIRIAPPNPYMPDSRLRAFATVHLSAGDWRLSIDDIRIYEPDTGPMTIGMPNKFTRIPCPECERKNDCEALYCTHCGYWLEGKDALRLGAKVRHDVVRPADAETREALRSAVVAAYRAYLRAARRQEVGV